MTSARCPTSTEGLTNYEEQPEGRRIERQGHQKEAINIKKEKAIFFQPNQSGCSRKKKVILTIWKVGGLMRKIEKVEVKFEY
jgi:hypothetical protein